MLEKDWSTKAGLRAVVLKDEEMGHRMGYVAVPKGHPTFGAGYGSSLLSEIDVHGGLTYADGHGEYPIEAPDLWWLGYDCAHSGDLVPGLVARFGSMGQHDVLRTLDYCERECERLAEQLSKPAALETEKP